MAEPITCVKTCAVESEYFSWFPTIAVVVLIVAMGLAALFAISRATGRREWEALARAELYQVGIAVIWVVIISSATAASCSISCSITGDESPFETSVSYISSIRSGLEDRADRLLQVAQDVRLSTALQFNILNIITAPFRGCEYVANNYETVAVLLAPFIGSLLIQQYALVTASTIAFQLLLPIGLILRIVPYLRDAGAYVMALSFALYVVFPLTYVFADMATIDIAATTGELDDPGLNCTNPAIAESLFVNIGHTLPQAVFFPALSMIITMAATRALSRVFAYDFQEILQS